MQTGGKAGDELQEYLLGVQADHSIVRELLWIGSFAA